MNEFTPADPKMVPYSREAEEATIGSSLINPDCIPSVRGVVKPSDFYIHRNVWVWTAIVKLDENSEPIDIVTVTEELDKMGKLAEIGGAAYITKLLNNVPSSLHAEAYAKRVAETAQRRKLIEIANEIAKHAYDESVDLSLGKMTDGIYQVTTSRLKRAAPWQEGLGRFQTDLEERMAAPYKDVWGMSYGNGFTRLNELTGGAQTGEFCIIAGKPGAGKSVIVADWVSEWSKNNWVAVYSMEMPEDVWIRRHVSREAGVSTRDLLRGEVQENSGSVFRAIKSLQSRKIILSDREDWTSDELRADLTRLKHKYDIQAVVIDHMGLLSDTSDSDITQSKIVAQRIRKAARALDIHIVAISAVTKEGFSDGYPTMKDVRGSGEVLHEADLVYWLNGFTPVTAADKKAVDEMSGQEKFQAKESMRTFFILKGRHLTGSNLKFKHLAFAHQRPTLAETVFPPEAQIEMPTPYKED